MTISALHELADRSVESDVIIQVQKQLAKVFPYSITPLKKKVDGVVDTHKIRARKMGHYTLIDVWCYGNHTNEITPIASHSSAKSHHSFCCSFSK